MKPTIVIHLDGKDWRVTRLDSLDVRPLDEGDERRGVVRYCPESERDEARDWVRRLTAESRVLTCVYCGHAYPPGSPEHGAEVLTEHIKTCEKHPMRALEAELALLLDDPVVAARAFKLKINATLRAGAASRKP